MTKSYDMIPFGRLLKFWRTVNNVSQEELAFRISSASRHISRLEKGETLPNREMVEKIASALELTERDRYNLLYSANYSSESLETDLHAPQYVHLREEILRNCKTIDPNPSIVIDISGNYLMANKAWIGLQSQLVPKDEFISVSNIYDLFFNYLAQESASQRWAEELSVLLLSLQQTIFFTSDKKLTELMTDLLNSPATPSDWKTIAARREAGGRFNIDVPINGELQRFFSHSLTRNFLGPLAFSAVPDMVIMTLYPEREELDLTPLVDHQVTHPLLFY